MSRAPKESPEEASSARFRQVLAEVARQRQDDQSAEETERSSFSSRPRADAIFSFDACAKSGGGSDWNAALAWIEEQDEPNPAPDPPPAEPDTPEAILKELGSIEGLNVDEL